MIDKKAIIAMAKSVLKRDQGVPDRRLIHPNREWFIGLFGFVIIVVGGSVVSAQNFVAYLNLDTVGGEATTRAPRYQQATIENAITIYQAKQVQFATYASASVPEPVAVEGTPEIGDIVAPEEESIENANTEPEAGGGALEFE